VSLIVFDTLIITDLMKRSTRPKGTVRVTQRIALHDTQRIACTTRNALRYAIYTQRVVLCDIHATRCVMRYTRNAFRYAIYTQRVSLCVQLLLMPSTLTPLPRFTRCALAWAFNGMLFLSRAMGCPFRTWWIGVSCRLFIPALGVRVGHLRPQSPTSWPCGLGQPRGPSPWPSELGWWWWCSCRGFP